MYHVPLTVQCILLLLFVEYLAAEFNVYMDGVMKEMKMGMGRRGVRVMEDGR